MVRDFILVNLRRGTLLKQNNQLLLAFDAEVESLYASSGEEVKRIVRKVAKSQRQGLVAFYDLHGRLPKTVTELYGSAFAQPDFVRLYEVTSLPPDNRGWVHHIPVRAFLRATQSFVDRENNCANRSTTVALKLVHAVYRADDRHSHWKRAASQLMQRGFTEEQISLLHNDESVRTACRKLLRPYHPL